MCGAQTSSPAEPRPARRARPPPPATSPSASRRARACRPRARRSRAARARSCSSGRARVDLGARDQLLRRRRSAVSDPSAARPPRTCRRRCRSPRPLRPAVRAPGAGSGCGTGPANTLPSPSTPIRNATLPPTPSLVSWRRNLSRPIQQTICLAWSCLQYALAATIAGVATTPPPRPRPRRAAPADRRRRAAARTGGCRPSARSAPSSASAA